MKNVTLIRHGESLGQTAKHRGLKRTDPSLHDCFLSRKGIQQAFDLRKDPVFENTFQDQEYDLICTSPLTRAMATCILAMHADTSQEEEDEMEMDYEYEYKQREREMERKHTRTRTRARTHKRRQQIIVRPEICEVGKIPENRGRDTHTVIKDLRKKFSHIIPLPALNTCLDNIDVSSMPPIWPDVEARTSKDDRNTMRMERFLQWLLNDREEENIVVFCHHNVIKILLNHAIDHVPNCTPIECVLTEEGGLRLKAQGDEFNDQKKHQKKNQHPVEGAKIYKKKGKKHTKTKKKGGK